jgi:peptide/nickel transport system permease protein
MIAYIIRRLLIMPIILIGVSLLIFLMLQIGLGPNERVALYVRDIPKTESQVAALIRRYGLDDPFFVQYWRWMTGVTDPETGEHTGGVLRGDLGFSRTGREPVIDLMIRRAPATLELAIWSVVPIIAIGIWLGIKAATNHNKPIDQFARLFAILGYSFPTFVFGLLVLLIFYARLGWFPPGRLSDWAIAEIRAGTFTEYTRMYSFDALINLRFDIFIDSMRHLILPVITLSYLSWALLLKVTRSSMLESLRQDFVLTAESKGLSHRNVVNKHVRPNALIPVATIAGATVAGLLNGVVITETIFNIPGLGSAAASAAVSLDALTMLGFALFNAVLFVLINLFVDVMYAFLDPRVRLT